MEYIISIEKVNTVLNIDVITQLGRIVDVMPSINPLYHVTYHVEKYKNGDNCGLWKDGRDLQPIKIFLSSNSNIIEVDSVNDVKILEMWYKGIKSIELGKDFVFDKNKIILLEYQYY